MVSVDKVNKMYKYISNIRENNIKCLRLYGNYLLNIVNLDEGKQYIDKSELIRK